VIRPDTISKWEAVAVWRDLVGAIFVIVGPETMLLSIQAQLAKIAELFDRYRRGELTSHLWIIQYNIVILGASSFFRWTN